MTATVSPVSEATLAFDWLLARPLVAVVAFACLQCLVWTLAPAVSHTAPPLDVVESYLWGNEWVVGSSKHPNMPGWVLEISRELAGAVGWPAYLASQLFVAATYLLVFALGSEMMDERRALAGTLLLAGIFYFAWPTIEFNHNVAQMPFWAAIALLLWRLRSSSSIVLWILLGLIAAGSLYAKLSSSLLIFVCGLWLVADPPLRRQLAKPAPWLGLLAFLIALIPLLRWLLHSNLQPLLYAAERSTEAGEGPLRFLAAQVLACAGLICLAAFAGFKTKPDPDATPLPPRATAFLATMTISPVLAATLIGLVAGTGLKSMWGSPMFGLAGLLAVALTTQQFTPHLMRRLAAAVAILMIVLPAGYVIDTVFEGRFTDRPKRQNWPQTAIAARFDSIWHQSVAQPLKIVAGERWIAGLTALRPGDMPSILTDGNLTLSPWITPDRLRQQGALVVWETKPGSSRPPKSLASLIGNHETGLEQFGWPLFPDAPPLSIGYAIVPPA